MLKNKFRNYCEPRKNLLYICQLFFTRAQGPSKSIVVYVTDLKNKAKDCEFSEFSDSLIRDRIVCGIRDDQLHARLLRESDLTLSKAIDVCRANEVASNQVKVLNEEAEVNKIRSVGNRSKNYKSKTKTVHPENKSRRKMAQHDQKTDATCSRCGCEHKQLMVKQ